MKRIYLGLALHNHQPVGNFPWVFEQVYHDAYLPMVETLKKHPSIRLSLHYSGVLLDWLKANHPEFIQSLGELVNRGQVEIMTGGYYEPILPSIPDADKLGQIEKLSTMLHDTFGYLPDGFWLAERVWEPHLPLILNRANVKWTILDDTHFKLAGLEEKDLFGYYLTEEQGNSLSVFASSKYLRYLIPWHKVKEVISYFRDQATEDGTKIAFMGDDGEKFGSWPKTYKYCWQKGWMENLFTALEENHSWLKTIPTGEYARAFPALGRIYLPCASYDEMGEWALPSAKSGEFSTLKRELWSDGRQDIVQYMCGGFWRNFMVKYPEINTMHKKMLRAHSKVHHARQLSEDDCGLDELWQGQCNCPYWHGVFGGVYMNDIRVSTFSNLIRAENKADAVLRSGHWLDYEEVDFDRDGQKELLVESDAVALYIDPARGGSIFEWDLRRYDYNLASVLTRHPEAYHEALLSARKKAKGEQKVETIHAGIRMKERGLRRHLHYDRYRRDCLLDHFLSNSASLANFSRSSYLELGDFIEQPYQYRVEMTTTGLKVLLEREGHLHYNRRLLPLKVEKELILLSGEDKLDVNYTLTNTGDTTISSTFGTEWNINLLGGGHSDQAYYYLPRIALDDGHLDSAGEVFDVQELALGNKNAGIEMRLELTPKMRWWRFPVEAICNSEGGLERVYQGSCTMLTLPFHLSPGEKLQLKLKWYTMEDQSS